MEKVDYLKLSEQYASFLVAFGGVSITVLTLVLSLGSDSQTPTGVNSRSFLVGALVVATVTCFIGAHMMAETAAFISNAKNNAEEIAERKRDINTSQLPPLPSPEEVVSGVRLFILASTNIFIAINLVLFALMLLPASSRRVHAASLAPISVGVFLVIIVVSLYWMILAANYRMYLPQSGWATWSPVIIVSVLGVIFYFLPVSKECLLWVAFAPSALSTAISLVWFAWIFKEGDTIRLQKARIQDIWFFSLAISLSYTPLVVAVIKTVLGKQFAVGEF
ncbi:MAG TPA: hypothetical protein VK363_00020 [Pyrinomonadaceae bacterium]|nr:hypothetical protein [Pyrinomonadaceae bacterium]